MRVLKLDFVDPEIIIGNRGISYDKGNYTVNALYDVGVSTTFDRVIAEMVIKRKMEGVDIMLIIVANRDDLDRYCWDNKRAYSNVINNADKVCIVEIRKV